MKKIAVIFEENVFDRKGAFNAKCARVKHLADLTGWKIDVYCIQLYQNAFVSSVLGRRSIRIPGEGLVAEKDLRGRKSITLDGLELNLVWKDYSVLDHLLFYKLHLRPAAYPRFLERNVSLLEGYDAVAAHSFVGAYIAREAKRRYGIPYYITWHGSDIHSTPFRHPQIKELTAELMIEAKVNCFVSAGLMSISDRIGGGSKTVLHNGCGEAFIRFDEQRRKALRSSFGAEGRKVVTFAGNLMPVKNPESLPEIFRTVQERMSQKVEFWVVGDGKSRSKVEAAMKSVESVSCRFWGNLPPERMPEIFNCTDVLVLPSRNEGLPLVVAEAAGCGAAVVAARVGGVSEILDDEYTVEPGPGFEAAMAEKIVLYLCQPCGQPLKERFDWERTARREKEIIESITADV